MYFEPESRPTGDFWANEIVFRQKSVPQGPFGRVKIILSRKSVPQGAFGRLNYILTWKSVPQGPFGRLNFILTWSRGPQGGGASGIFFAFSTCLTFLSLFFETFEISDFDVCGHFEFELISSHCGHFYVFAQYLTALDSACQYPTLLDDT